MQQRRTIRMNTWSYPRRGCDFCGHCFTPQIESQRFCGPACRRHGRAMEAKAARRAWAEQGAEVALDVRRDFLAERGLWKPEGERFKASLKRR